MSNDNTSHANSAKNNILQRLALAGLDANDVAAVKGKGSVDSLTLLVDEPAVELRQSFVDKMQASHAEVIACVKTDLQKTINDLLVRKQFKQLLISERVGWVKDMDIGDTQCLYFADNIESFKQQLFTDIDAAITTSHGSIADTGSIILRPDSVEPRSMSLVPPVHIVIVEEQSMHPNFAQVMKQEQWQTCMPTNMILVSGPSKTADIQQTLAYGAHGPRELIVILVAAV
jgi:L-lactate dehydrogenase complex protein LldG|tara:strand:+ start:4399 stop:5088 length:690 start_codon:yes stop_codon:yes gene_type:complete